MLIWEVEPLKITASMSDKIINFYGEKSTRKTSVAAAFPKCLIFGFEKGYLCINGVYAIPIDSWATFKDYLRQLKDPRAKEKFGTIAIDTVRKAYDACYSWLLSTYNKQDIGEIGTKGKGWSLLKKEFSDVMNSIPKMGYGLVLITHAVESEKDGNVVIKTDLDKTATEVVNQLCDFQFYVRKEDDENGNPSVFAYSDVSFAETKCRLRYFPNHFEFTYENLIKAYETALEEEKKRGAVLDESEITSKNMFSEDFETLKKSVIDLVLELQDNDEVYEYISTHFDIGLSEADDTYYDAFIAARDFLNGIKNGR